jgi:hypothetical protein
MGIILTRIFERLSRILSTCVKKNANTVAVQLDEDESKTLVSEENNVEQLPEVTMLLELQGNTYTNNYDTSHKLNNDHQTDSNAK